jgi:hypothetical protein
MKRRRAVPSEGFEVVGSGVTLVAREAILRVDSVPLFHARVAMSFGEDRGGGDRYAACVALDERLLLDLNIQLHGVDEQIIRLDGKLFESGSHGLAAGLIDIPGVDALGIDFRNGPGESVFVNACGKFGAAFSGEFLRIVEADNATLGIENNCGGDDGAEESAAAGFIETGDAHPAKLSRRSLETGRAEAAHCAEILARRPELVRSLVSQCDDGIDPGGAPRGEVVCRKCYKHQKNGHAGECDRVGRENSVQ